MSADLTIGYFAKVQGGFAYKSKDFKEAGTPVIKIKNVGQGRLLFDDYSCVNDELVNATKDFLTRPGDVLISMTGSGPSQPASVVGRVAKVSKNDPLAVINQRVGRLVLREKGSIDLRYLYYLLSTKNAKDYLVYNSTGSANQANISGKTIESLPVPKVSYSASITIADILEAMDDKIELNRQINQTLEQIAQAIFKSWFVDFDPAKAKIVAKHNGRDPQRAAMCAISGKTDAELDQLSPNQHKQLAATAGLFPDELEESELGLIPRGWGVFNIGTIADIIDCLHSKKPKAAKDKTDRILLQLNNIGNDGLLYLDDTFFISEEDYKKWISRIEVSDGDCVITNVGRVGDVAIIPKGVRAAIGRNMTAVRLKDKFPCAAFLITLLSSKYMRREIEYRTDIGTILNALNVKSIPKLRFVYGGNRMIETFENMVSPILKQRQQNVIQNVSLSQIRDTLLPKLLSGEIDLSQVA